MAIFSQALEYVLKNEDGISYNPVDNGDITNFGISLRFLKSVDNLKKYGINKTPDANLICALTLDQIHDIYKGEFWNAMPFVSINDQDICNYIFDMSVNLGILTAIKCAQRAIWAVWNHYLALADDGILGHETLMWIERCKPERLLPALRSERASVYRIIIKEHPTQEAFAKGWYARAYGSLK